MNSSLRFRINTPTIVHEAIEGEVVIINLENGNYYSLDGIGASIWDSIGKGESVGEIVGLLDFRYQADDTPIEQSVEQFLAELEQDDLVAPDEPGSNSIDPSSKTQDGNEKLTFEAPVLNRYTDMQDLLLLDPIHDVDEAGWPNLPPEQAEN